MSRARNTKPIALARHRGHVGDGDSAWGSPRAKESKHRVRAIVTDNPGEAFLVAVASMQGRLVRIGEVKVANQAPHACMQRVVRQPPIDLTVVVPFASCAISSPMKTSFLPGCPHMKPK